MVEGLLPEESFPVPFHQQGEHALHAATQTWKEQYYHHFNSRQGTTQVSV